MKIPVTLMIDTETDDVYEAFDRAEAFVEDILKGLDNEKRRTGGNILSANCIKAPRGKKLHFALGFPHYERGIHSFECRKRYPDGKEIVVGEYDSLSDAAEANGKLAREWRTSSNEAIENLAGVWELHSKDKLTAELYVKLICRKS